MPTSGLVVTAAKAENVEKIAEAIAAEPRFEVAAPSGLRLPVVLDTPDKATDKQLWEWLNSLPGVAHVDIAFISLEDGSSLENGSEEELSQGSCCQELSSEPCCGANSEPNVVSIAPLDARSATTLGDTKS